MNAAGGGEGGGVRTRARDGATSASSSHVPGKKNVTFERRRLDPGASSRHGPLIRLRREGVMNEVVHARERLRFRASAAACASARKGEGG
jgi:hypothetical protein|eukprot:31260-Pelagococcus_subviridis.AAC.31